MDKVDYLREIVSKGKQLGYGAFGNVIEYNDILYKIPSDIHYLVDHENTDNKIISYFNSVDHEQFKEFIEERIKIFNERQKNILYTKLPYGVSYLEYFDKYSYKRIQTPYAVLLKKIDGINLSKAKIKDKEEFLFIMKLILSNLKELCDNGIYQKDIHESNIMIQKHTVNIIDLDGDDALVGVDSNEESDVFTAYYYMLNYLIRLWIDKKFNCPIGEYEVLDNYEDSKKYLKELDRILK